MELPIGNLALYVKALRAVVHSAQSLAPAPSAQSGRSFRDISRSTRFVVTASPRCAAWPPFSFGARLTLVK
jgi:hypothetical protein